ncbi:hypothetical protein B7486_77730, partial [cyanobacterium TDX16]
LFAVVVGIGLPAGAAGVVLLAGRLHRRAHALVVGLLATVAAAGVLGHLVGSVVLFALSVAAGVLVARFEPRSPGVRGLMVAAGVLGLVVLVWFVALSPSGGLVRTGEVDAEALPPPAADEPVVLITLDELPLSALLDEDLEINAERFPSFARLAEQSDWYPRASAASASALSSV